MRLLCLRGAGARRLAATFALATVVVWVTAVAADSHLVALGPTAFILDQTGTFVTQSGHETMRADGSRQVEYGYWPVAPPDRVVRATLALEDRRFWSHPGVDGLAVGRAVFEHLRGGHGSGASTLAMQVARMQHPRPRTLWAKTVEAGTALVLTARYGRAAVLAQYLRLAPYGEGSHGIAHAAEWYFAKPAADLTWAEATLLAAVPQAPALMALHRHTATAAARARRAVLALRLPSDAQTAALAELASLHPRVTPLRPPQTLLALRVARAALRGGRVQRTTVDLATDAAVVRLAQQALVRFKPEGAQQVAVMVVRRSTRDVLAEVGSAGAGTPGGAIDYAAARRSPGSTLKPFLYARALELGVLTPQDVMNDLPQGAGGIANADHDFLGPLLPSQALANSRNVPATNLLRRLGEDEGFDFFRRLGLHQLDTPADQYGLGMAIGTLPTSLERLMRAYTTLADDGVDAPLRWMADAPPTTPRRLISAQSARVVGRFLSDPMARLPSFPRYGSLEFPFPVAVKTGTSQGYRDAWAFAWSDQYVIGVWFGRSDAGSMTALSGSRAAATLTQSILLWLHGVNRSDLFAGDLPAPPGLRPSELCTHTSHAAGGACPDRLVEGTADNLQSSPASEAALAIVRPDPNMTVWRNPEAPPGLDRLMLTASAAPAVQQVVWLVDGQAAAVASPREPFYWPLTAGQHRFQLRLPLQATVSAAINVTVQ